MRKFLPVVLIIFFLLSSCAPTGSTAADPIKADEITSPVIVEDAGKQTPTEMTVDSQLTPTVMPTSEPTQALIRFDLDGYRQFALTHDYFQGLDDYFGDRSHDTYVSKLSPSGDQIALAGCFGSMTNTSRCETSQSGYLVVLDSNNGDILNEIPLGTSWPGSVDFTSDGMSLLVATNEYKIALWDLKTNKPGLTLFAEPAPDTNYFPDVAAAPDGQSMAAVIDDSLYVWDPNGELLLQAPAYKLMISAGLKYSANGSRLTVFSPEHVGVDVYDTNTWTLLRRIPADQIIGVAISPNGQFVAATNRQDDTVNVWDVEGGTQVAYLDPGNWADALQFNPAGDMLIISGMGNLDTRDSYSNLAALYETQTWTQVDTLYSFLGDGRIEFNQDGSRMAVFGFMGPTIWGLPDEKLKKGFEVVKQFQESLSSGDYDTAASLFEVNAGDEDFLSEMGLDPTDLPASFERLCENQEIFCHPVHELVMMGNDWDDMVYLVRLEDSNGDVFTSPKGAHIIYFYLYLNADGEPRVSYPPVD